MRLYSVFTALIYASVARALPSKGCTPKLKEEVIPPHKWQNVGPAPADHRIELRIGLVQPNFPLLEQHLYEIRYAPALRKKFHV